MLLNCKS